MGSWSQDHVMPKVRRTALVVGTDEWAADQAAGALRRGGVEVLRCHHPGDPDFPCNAFISGRVCPLDAGFDVVVTARARSSPKPESGEMGVICALRTGHPMVVAGVIAGHPFASVTAGEVPEGGNLLEAVAAASESERAGPQDLVDLRSLPR